MDTNVVYCPTCDLQVLATPRASYSQDLPDPGYGELSSEVRTWTLLECPRCGGISLRKEEYLDVEGTSYLQETNILYPPAEEKNPSLNTRLPWSLCAAVGDALISSQKSHDTLNALFIDTGAPGEPPNLSHPSKWKTWLHRAGEDPRVDSLRVLGGVLEEFMDIAPLDDNGSYSKHRERVLAALRECGLSYFRHGRVMPVGTDASTLLAEPPPTLAAPRDVDEVLDRLIRGLPRAIHPLARRRKGAASISFDTEHDIQDLLHAMMRPWISNIQDEEYVPRYAGTNKRMDFLLPRYRRVLEIKYVRDLRHARKIGDELTIDIAHYRAHRDCDYLWCIIYDPHHLIKNPASLADLEGPTSTPQGSVHVRVCVIQ